MRSIKKIYWGNIEGEFREVDNRVTIVWRDGEVLTMQSDLFFKDWLPRVAKNIKVIYG